ncbi:MAG: sugar phosphate nucleotidyltransferase [Desulfatitalea sp.]
MKAMILAAGLGTRLLPFTGHTPKPLFTLNQRPVLDLILERLQRAGCSAAVINTHHHRAQIEAFVARQPYPIRVQTRHEPEILGTGGAIRNVADFWPDGPLLVVNADIVSDIDLARVFAFHGSHDGAVTMVMHDHARFNSVLADPQDWIVGFDASQQLSIPCRTLAFTGIHVLDRRVLDFLPTQGPAHIIDAYTRMLQSGERIKALIVHDHYWQDIGTPESYRAAAMDHMVPMAFEKAFGQRPRAPVVDQTLQGDGSDRRWHRLKADGQSLIMVDHGIRPQREGQQEVDAFIQIGRHLRASGVSVPHIHLYDPFAGLVFLEDLGDLHLQDAARAVDTDGVQQLYRRVIDQWLHMAVEGGRGFDVAWTWQSTHYDRELIIERECRYFVNAFLNGYLGKAVDFSDLAPEFEQLAAGAMEYGWMGFMHRDLQSRNIMIHGDRIGFIDFQGGRLGPLQYDLASLLIDPYVALPVALQEALRDYAVNALSTRTDLNVDRFLRGYDYCALTRNLQMLGAFGFLSRVKGKRYFEAFIPHAVATLDRRLPMSHIALPRLMALAAELGRHFAA